MGTQLVPQSTVRVTFDGQVMVTGGLGRTVTVKVQVFVPQALVARQVTGVTARGKQKVGGGVQPVSTPLSTVGAGYATGVHWAHVSTVMLVGQVMMGAEPPCVTVILNWQTLLFWQRSSAMQVTGVTPQGKKVPEAGVQFTETTPLLSLATGAG